MKVCNLLIHVSQTKKCIPKPDHICTVCSEQLVQIQVKCVFEYLLDTCTDWYGISLFICSVVEIQDWFYTLHRNQPLYQVEDEFLPDPISRYRHLLFAALKFCLAVLTSLGVENTEAGIQVMII